MTSTETRSSWSNRLSPRNWSLAWKLVAVGLVPALLAVVLGVLRVADQAQTASELGAANRLLEVRAQVADTATALRAERDRATVFLAERRLGDRGPMTEAAAATDKAIERVRGDINDSDLDAATRTARERSDGGLAQLAVLRSGVTASAPLLPTQVLQRYTTIIDRVDGFDRALLRQVRTPEIAGLTDALSAVTAASEALALQHTVLGVSLRTGTVTADDRALVGVTDGSFVTAYSDYQLALPPSLTPVNFVTSENNAQRDAAKSAIVLSPTPGPIPITTTAWDEAVGRVSGDLDRADTDVRTALSTASQTAEARSSNLAGVNSVLLMLGLLLAATIVVLVARSLTRSLRVLRTSALDVAQRRLPQAVESMRSGNTPDVTVEPVPLGNRDEVGQVARAFDAVHGQALRLAADQAALQSNVSSMFVNLSRRSQGLVERQLQLIEQLESNEQDPDQLSNLFQLDHLATRMRRNSENLLVLAGTDFAKRNVAPVPLVDVLRAAVSEIEHYQRITVQAPPQATIVGRATSDVVHLLAELLDNATNFSPPESQVVMSSMRTPDGSILVEIADRGVGMLDHELTDANRRLTTPSAVDVSASRRMGLFVVGRLGARHGITVHLGGAPMGGPGGGLTASVTLPAHLVVSAGEDGEHPQRGESLASVPATANGVPPQRAALANRPTPRTTLSAPANGQALPQPAGRSGLPTRTPGSALRRTAAAAGPAAPVTEDAGPSTRDQPGVPQNPAAGGEQPLEPRRSTGRPDGVRPDGGQPDGARPDGGRPDGARPDGGRPDGAPFDRERPDREQTGADRFADPDADSDADSVPTGTLPAVAGAAGAAGAVAARDERSTPDAGREAADETTDDTPASGGRGEFLAARGPAGATRADLRADAGTDEERTGDTARAEADEAVETDGADTATAGTGEPRVTDGAESGEADRSDPDQPAARGDERGDDRPSPAPVGRPAPRPRPSPGPTRNGTYRDMSLPSTPYPAPEPVASGSGQNGGGQNGDVHYADRNGGQSPATTPIPVVPPGSIPLPAASDTDDDGGADALFSASVPAIAEPEGLPRSRRPLGELRRGAPPDLAETTPIFEEIASAWFASQRPVPVDWELGQRPGAEPIASTAAPAAPGPLAGPEPQPAGVGPRADADRTAVSAASHEAAPDVEPSPFASAADEGWRAANGAAAERPDELTAAGLPKRRPRARLVPGSAGSAVLAAPASPTRSAESIRGRLASYQQGVRQGREIRLRRDPGGAGPQPASAGEDAAPTGGEHDEETR